MTGSRRFPNRGEWGVSETHAQRAKCCVASALEYADEEWPENLNAALSQPESAWPTPALAALARWLLKTKRSGLVPSVSKLFTNRSQ